MRVLVTGGAGFIGSHLCEKLIEEGNEVICLDNMFTGSYSNIASLFDKKGFKFVNGNVINPFVFEVDAIFNLACPASPVQYQYDPVMTAKTSFMGMLNALNLARANGARILQASTSEVYGNPAVHPQTEDYHGDVNPIGIRACYDEGKRIAETLCADYHRQYGVDVRIARIFNTYGPRMLENDGRVISNFIVQALRNEELTVYGEGLQTRSFCFVSDTVEGLTRMMKCPTKLGPINIGNPQELRILDLAKMIISLTNSRSQIVFKDLPEDDPVRRKPDISQARALIHWQPTTDIEVGLLNTIQYFQKLRI